jgi:hypothetical protein
VLCCKYYFYFVVFHTVLKLIMSIANSLGISSLGGSNSAGQRGPAGVGVTSITFVDNVNGTATLTFNMSDGSTQGPFTTNFTSDTITNVNQLTLTATANANKLEVKDAGGNVVFNVNTSTDAVTTRYNTLDDGSGNTQIGDAGTINPIFRVKYPNHWNALSVDTTTGLTFVGTNATTFQPQNSDGPVIAVSNLAANMTPFQVTTGTNNAGTSIYMMGNLTFANDVGTAFSVNNSGVVASIHNTLDDGSGNLTTTGNISTSGVHSVSGFTVTASGGAVTGFNFVGTSSTSASTFKIAPVVTTSSSGVTNNLTLTNLSSTATSGTEITFNGHNSSATAKSGLFQFDGNGFNAIAGGSGGAVLANGTTSWSAISAKGEKDLIDDNLDHEFHVEMLDKLPIHKWSYKFDEDKTVNIGPYAQDVVNKQQELINQLMLLNHTTSPETM